MPNPDFLIIGAGIIGLSIARRLQVRFPDCKVIILEKEDQAGCHASGRNSGVLHSGIYYTSDSLKAKFSRDGNRQWQEYCFDRGLQVDKCGKLIVPRTLEELHTLSVLEQRGRQNSVEVIRIDSREACEIEPKVKVFEQALFIPSTSTIDPKMLVSCLQDDFLSNGGLIKYNCRFLSRSGGSTVRTTQGLISAGYIVNCAGLYADRVAHAFGFGKDYSVLPFKGLYLYADAGAYQPRVHLYPVPDLGNPFLGVHFTRTIHGHIKIGPTAIPALWRENYRGLKGFRLDEFIQVAGTEVNMFVSNKNNFRKLAWQELKKQFKYRMVQEAGTLFSGADRMHFNEWGRPGIRAQLLNKKTGSMEMDFILEGDEKSMHVLNAVSPALTCALPFADYVVDRIESSDRRVSIEQCPSGCKQ